MHSVTRISPHDTVPRGLDDLLDLIADFAIGYTRLADGDSRLHGSFRGCYEVHRFLVDLTNGVCRVQVTVQTAVD